MRIESSALNMQGGSSVVSMTSIQESLNVWTGQGSVNTNSSSFDVQEFSQQSIRISSAVTSSVSASSEPAESDAVTTKEEMQLRMLEEFLRRITGKAVKFRVPRLTTTSDGYTSRALPSNNLCLISPTGIVQSKASPAGALQRSAGFGLIYNRNEIQVERSRVTFEAEGVVKTADGREINLNLNFNIDQEVVQQSSFQLRAGDALKDPLVINFAGSVASFTERSMSFDLDFDGDKDTVQMLNANSGYLALDKNNNGTVDDGRELFGPQTDNGYGELAKYDDDGNGWIDENDSIFNHLEIWYHDEQGNSRLVALTEKNVGAIYLGSVDTQMNMYNQSGMTGALKQSGLVLLESGESRVMQELDLKI